MYDIVFISYQELSADENYAALKARFPMAKHVHNVKDIHQAYTKAAKKCFTKMFWVVWSDTLVHDDFDFSYKADDYSLDVVHVFKNDKHFDGICLFPKKIKVHEKELQYRFFQNKKEVDIVASTPVKYDIFTINTYEEFCELRKKASTDFFYVVPNDVDVDWDFNYHIPYYERENIHVFKNSKYHDGVFLIHKDKPLAQREFDYRFFVNKKEIDITVSTPKPFDIVFISYNEPNADENYAALSEKFPRAKRVHGVKGIHQAHIAAAEICDTDMFWIVDGDAQIVDGFNFDFQSPKWQRDNVYVWRSINPINDLVYGYGGIKLFPRNETLIMDTTKPDMTTSISSKFNAVEETANITAFNTDAFSTWRSAFRECAKLSSKTILRQNDEETETRLNIWCTKGSERRCGDFAIAGANAGREFGISNMADLNLINNFEWLHEQFSKHTI